MAFFRFYLHCKIFTRIDQVMSKEMNVRIFQYQIQPQHKLARLANTSATDALDHFAEKLVQEKAAKWDALRSQKYMLNTTQQHKNKSPKHLVPDPYKNEQISKDSSENEDSELDNIIIGLVERNDILSLLQNCIEHNCCPSSKILLELASKFSRLGDKAGIETVQNICKQGNVEEYDNQAGYKHFMAEATWVCGNLENSLAQFLEVYKHHLSLRRKVRGMIRFLIEDVVTRRGEAQLVNITRFSKMLALQYGDYMFLAFLWQYCFVSEWFSDQRVATSLLHEHSDLKNAIIDRIPIVTMKALREHKVDTVQRLLETLLQSNMKLQYGQVLRVYFDYRCNQGDLQSCSAIVQSSLELNVMLTASQHQKFLSLLLDEQHRHKWKGRARPTLNQPPTLKPFQFKF